MHPRWLENNLIQLIPGCVVRKSPISAPLPVTAEIKPFGKPAKWNVCTMCKHDTAPCGSSLKYIQLRLLYEVFSYLVLVMVKSYLLY